MDPTTYVKFVVASLSVSSGIQNVSNGHSGHNIPEDMNVQQHRRHDAKSRSDSHSATLYNHGRSRRVKVKAVPLLAKQAVIGVSGLALPKLDLGARRW